MNNFLTEYVFDEKRIKDGVIDFKLDIAIRGDISMCLNKGKHKADKLLYLASFLMDIPKPIFSYCVKVAKEYYNDTDVDKVASHVITLTPLTYLFTSKVIADLNEVVQYPKDAKKSLFCRYVEDLAEYDLKLAKDLLLEVSENYYCDYLKEIAQLYLTNINDELAKIEKHEEQKELNKEEFAKQSRMEFLTVWKAIIEMQIVNAPLLSQPKKKSFEDFLRNIIQPTTVEEDEEEVKAKLQELKDNGIKIINITEVSEDEIDDEEDYEDYDITDSPLISLLDRVLQKAKENETNANLLESASQDLLEATKKFDEQVQTLNEQLNSYNEEMNCKYKVIKRAPDISKRVISEKVFDNKLSAINWLETLKEHYPQTYENFDYIIEKA